MRKLKFMDVKSCRYLVFKTRFKAEKPGKNPFYYH